jgi:predicted transcriptional regulator
VRLVGRKPKLSPDQVRQLREWAAFGRNQTDVARRMGISTGAVRNYLRGTQKAFSRETV